VLVVQQLQLRECGTALDDNGPVPARDGEPDGQPRKRCSDHQPKRDRCRYLFIHGPDNTPSGPVVVGSLRTQTVCSLPRDGLSAVVPAPDARRLSRARVSPSLDRLASRGQLSRGSGREPVGLGEVSVPNGRRARFASPGRGATGGWPCR